MSQQWLWTRDGQQAGPYETDAVRTMLANGQIAPTDLLWSDGMPEWLPATQIPAFSGMGRPGYAAPLAYQTPPAYSGRRPPYAGFWLRFCAAFLDGLILRAIGFALGLALGGVLNSRNASRSEVAGVLVVAQVLELLIGWLYFAMQESSEAQATLGKRACGIVVTNLNGQRISFGQATGRFFGKIVSAIILLIGYIMAGFTEKKQALHDMMASTLVLRK